MKAYFDTASENMCQGGNGPPAGILIVPTQLSIVPALPGKRI
jgi:hypothetical protein